MPTWMVVEDEPDLYQMILAMYEAIGIGGVAFVTGEDAVEWIEEVEAGHREDEVPELALIDIRLPGRISGDRIGARIRESPNLRNTAIVLMTAYRLSPEDERYLIETAQADLLLHKPLPRLPELRRILFELVDARAT